MTEKELTKELRSAKVEINEMRVIRDKQRQQVKDLEASNLYFRKLNTCMYTGLMVERNELMTRVQRIDCRIEALGFPRSEHSTIQEPPKQ